MFDGRIWYAIKTSKLADYPYPQLKEIPIKDWYAFYNKEGFKGNNYRQIQIKEHDRNRLYNRLGFSISTVLISYSIVFLIIIFLIVHVAHWLATYTPHP